MSTTLDRLDFWVRNALGQAVAGAQLYLAAQPANITSVPPAPLIQLYADNNGVTPLAQPLNTDGLGHVAAYGQAQLYTLVVVNHGVIQNVFPDQAFFDLGGTETLPPSGNATQVATTTNLNLAAFGEVLIADGSGNVQDSGAPLSSLATVVSVTAETNRAEAAEALLAPEANAALTGTTTIVNANGVLNATLFAGADIGAKVNTAIAQLVATGQGGTVYIPAGTYSQSTTIYLPPYIKLCGAAATGTILNWTPTTGWAIVIAGNDAGLFNNFGYQGALEDLTLNGPGSTTSTGAVYLGGSDGASGSPTTGNDPATNQCWAFNINRVRLVQTSGAGTFGVGFQWGTNAWSQTFLQCTIQGCATGVYFPAGIGSSNSGENITFVGCIIANNTGIGVSIGTGNDINVNLIGCSLDSNGSWAVQNATAGGGSSVVSLTNSYIFSEAKWLQNYGYMNLTSCYFTGGTNSGVLGYLINNEGTFVMTGSQLFPGGSGTLFNAGGVKGYWLGTTINGTGLTGGGIPTELFNVALAGSSGQQGNYAGGAAVDIANLTTAGAVRVSWSQFIVVAGSVSSTFPSLTLGWTDADNVARTKTLVATSATNTTAVESDGVAVIFPKAGVAVTVTSASYANGGGANQMTYDIAIVAEIL